MATGTTLGLLADIAEAQQGLITTRQAEQAGVARRDLSRLVATAGLERVAHGVYRVGGAPRPRLQELRAAWLQLAPGIPVDQRTVTDGVVSHLSATLVYDVGLLEPRRYEFTTPLPRRVRTRRADVVIHRAQLNTADVDWVEEILVTTPVRTVADLCALRLDGDHLAGVVTDVLRKKLASRRQLGAAVAPYAAAYGIEPAGEFLPYLLHRGGDA
jgi:predicted transcriptional regulator of viral defense system